MKRNRSRWTGIMELLVVVAATLGLVAPAGEGALAAQEAPDPESQPVRLVLQPDEAEATIRVLETQAAGEPVAEEAWLELFDTDGFRRVLERELAMNELVGYDRGFSPKSFRDWAESDASLSDLDGIRAGLEVWREVDLDRAGALALAYLPEHARIRATVYPLVREQTNSFVFDLGGERPAIFMYVAPGQSAAALEHTLAHELHHVGFATACAAPAAGAEDDLARSLLRGFAEGVAVLAAAGGPDGETHPFDDDEVRDNWARRLDSLDTDMAAFETFMDSVLTGRMTTAEAHRRVFRFITSDGVPQGPFYSLGWHMAATIERELGRETLVDGLCRPERLLLDYDVAAATIAARDPDAAPPRWSDSLLDRLRERIGRI